MTETQVKVQVGDYFRTQDGHCQWTVLGVTHETIDCVPFIRFRVQVGETAPLEQIFPEDSFLKMIVTCKGIACQLVHQFTPKGNHRLALVGRDTALVLEAGKLVNHFAIARLGKWAAVTEYHGWGEGSAFPTEIFEIQPSTISSRTAPAPEW